MELTARMALKQSRPCGVGGCIEDMLDMSDELRILIMFIYRYDKHTTSHACLTWDFQCFTMRRQYLKAHGSAPSLTVSLPHTEAKATSTVVELPITFFLRSAEDFTSALRHNRVNLIIHYE